MGERRNRWKLEKGETRSKREVERRNGRKEGDEAYLKTRLETVDPMGTYQGLGMGRPLYRTFGEGMEVRCGNERGEFIIGKQDKKTIRFNGIRQE